MPERRQWLTVSEAAARSGYNREHVLKLARENAELPPEQQLVRVDKVSERGYLIYWPSLVNYIYTIGRGPQGPRQKV